MYNVGVALHSDYTPSGTGATDVDVVPTLVRYFNYDPGARYVQRDYTAVNLYEQGLINEIEAGRPVPYGGVTRRTRDTSSCSTASTKTDTIMSTGDGADCLTDISSYHLSTLMLREWAAQPPLIRHSNIISSISPDCRSLKWVHRQVGTSWLTISRK